MKKQLSVKDGCFFDEKTYKKAAIEARQLFPEHVTINFSC